MGAGCSFAYIKCVRTPAATATNAAPFAPWFFLLHLLFFFFLLRLFFYFLFFFLLSLCRRRFDPWRDR